MTTVWTAIGVLVLAIATQSVGPQETSRCILTAPKYQAKGSEVVFEITIDCGSTAANATPFPIGEEILVGLTVYAGTDDSPRQCPRRVIDAAPEVKAALKGTTQSRSVTAAGGPKWIVLEDAATDSYDLSAQVIRVERSAKRLPVQFQTDQKAIADKQYYLFAAWAASERKPCERESKYSRSGCQRDGYVIGDNSGVWPIAAYPGMEINECIDPNGDEYTAERWIVERFR